MLSEKKKQKLISFVMLFNGTRVYVFLLFNLMIKYFTLTSINYHRNLKKARDYDCNNDNNQDWDISTSVYKNVCLLYK